MIKDRLYVAIDNGKMGGLAGIKNGLLEFKMTMPIIKSTKTKTEYDEKFITEFFRDLIKKHTDILVILEKNLIVPISGRLSIASTQDCFSHFKGLFNAFQIPYIIVPPKVWQKKIFEGMNSKDTKIASISYVTKLFPKEDFTLSQRSKKISDGITDAVCMAKYGELLY